MNDSQRSRRNWNEKLKVSSRNWGEITASLNFQGDEIRVLKTKVSTLEQKLSKKKTQLQEEIDNLAAYGARNNFVVLGLAAKDGEVVAQLIEEFS